MQPNWPSRLSGEEEVGVAQATEEVGERETQGNRDFVMSTIATIRFGVVSLIGDLNKVK